MYIKMSLPCIINLAILNNGKPTSFIYIDNTTTSAKSLFGWSVVHCLWTKCGLNVSVEWGCKKETRSIKSIKAFINRREGARVYDCWCFARRRKFVKLSFSF